jgi:choline-sulfatase
MPDERPNVLFLMSDEHSFRCQSRLDDAVGEPVETPALDGIAGSGTTFEQTYCPYPLCVPSRQCMLTGKEVQNCAAWANYLEPEHTTLPERFRDEGWETCLVGKMHLGGERQFAGFEHRPYGDLTGDSGENPEPIDPEKVTTYPTRQAIDKGTRIPGAGATEIPETMLQEQVTKNETLAWVREQEARSEEPWFVTASFLRPHFPLTAPRRHFERYWDTAADEPTDRLTEPKVGREGDFADHPFTAAMEAGFETGEFDEHAVMKARAGYFACVDYLDEIIGDLLSTLEREGYLENTVVVYASDHGEVNGEHGQWWKQAPWESSARVPMYVQTPAQRAGEVDAHAVETPTSLTDLFPTLCGLVDIDAPDDIDGVDLSTAVETGAEPDRGPVVCDKFNDNWGADVEWRMVRDGDYKYVGFRDAPELLFDMAADPRETENLAPDAAGEDREALQRLRSFVADTVDWEENARRRERDQREFEEEHALGIPTGTGNAYHLPDGRVVDAMTPIYHPHVITDNPERAYEDYPGDPARGPPEE